MASQDLTTLANVRSFLQKQTSDTAQDTIISSLITRASDAIMRYTQREFAPTTSSAARVFALTPTTWPSGGILSLAPYDLRSVTSIVIDSDTSSSITLDTSQYRLRPVPNAMGVYTHIYLNPTSGHPSSTRFEDREVTITGAWGFSSIPTDVEHACILTVVNWLRDEVSAFTTAYADEVNPPNNPMSSLPQDVRAVLIPYLRAAYI